MPDVDLKAAVEQARERDMDVLARRLMVLTAQSQSQAAYFAEVIDQLTARVAKLEDGMASNDAETYDVPAWDVVPK